MARLVLDTNILVSAVVGKGSPRKLLQACIDGHHTLLESPQTLEELSKVIARPKFKMTEEEAGRIVTAIVQTAEFVETHSHLTVIAADADDDRFLELAVDGKADLLVSGDKHLLALEEFAGIPIVKAVEALRRLDLA